MPKGGGREEGREREGERGREREGERGREGGREREGERGREGERERDVHLHVKDKGTIITHSSHMTIT